MKYIYNLFIILSYFFSFSILAYNPHPIEDDLILPMPNGESLVLRAVPVEMSSNLNVSHKFIMGDTLGGFSENPTAVTIGGSFLRKINNNTNVLYYIGKYEITEKQYKAVMELHPKPNSEKGDDYPVTSVSWFEVKEFINKYNKWLYLNSKNELLQKHNAYIRLPTEVEWEFAARGAIAVNQDQFEQRTPYGENLIEHEWFSGERSSHNKIKKSGILKANPLGIYDLLGNVSEITGSIYQIEYYQGRYGGFVVRGASSFIPEEKISSSYRIEKAFYRKQNNNVIENSSPDLGFRVVLAATIPASSPLNNSSSITSNKLNNIPDKITPETALSMSKLTSAIQNDIKNERSEQLILDEIKKLRVLLNKNNLLVKEAEKNASYAWVKIASDRAQLLLQQYHDKKRLSEFLEHQASPLIQHKIGVIDTNISNTLQTYGDSLREMDKLRQEVLLNAYKRYYQYLTSHNASKTQIDALELTKKHMMLFLNNKRTNYELWKRDFMAF